ncbi:MAG: hypothetical protein ABEJ87_02525 [Candidatus Nanohalobium sp.]
MKLFEELQDLEEVIEEKKEEIKEEIQEELGAKEENILREATKQGYPGNTDKDMMVLKTLNSEEKSLEPVKEALQEIETSKIEEKIKEIKEERQQTDNKGKEQIMYGYSSTVQSLEEAQKLLKGKEYRAERLGRSAAITFPDPYLKIEDQLGLKNDFLKEFREENVHLLLRTSKTLGDSNQKTELKNKGLESLINHKKRLREELRKRAEDLDYLLTNAAVQLKETRGKKKKL